MRAHSTGMNSSGGREEGYCARMQCSEMNAPLRCQAAQIVANSHRKSAIRRRQLNEAAGDLRHSPARLQQTRHGQGRCGTEEST